MNPNHRRHLHTLLETYHRRLRLLDEQIAAFGPRTPPEVRIERDDVYHEIGQVQRELGATLAETNVAQMWQQALIAYFAGDWSRAEALLAHVAAFAPQHEDVQIRLAEARRHLALERFYNQICAMRAQGAWQAVLGALDELALQAPGYPDSANLRRWAERQRRRAEPRLCAACGDVMLAGSAFCPHCGARNTR